MQPVCRASARRGVLAFRRDNTLKMSNVRGRLLASTMITGAALIAMGGLAHAADASSAGPVQTASAGAGHVSTAAPLQTLTASTDATADTTSGTAVTEIVVTGSRIPQPNLTSVSPIQAVSHQEFQLQGATDVIDLLNTLPQNFQNNTSDFSNTTNPLTSPGGITTADLRGLGPQRTLVLVNGRRLGIGDPNTGDQNPAPDLDQIPVALIDHVEVLTGGASATYGSDAVAGVVNFIMKKDFEGVQIDGQYGGDQHSNHNIAVQQAVVASGGTPASGDKWDGQNTDFSVIFGANAPDGKGNVTGYFEFKNADPVTEGARDFSGCLLVQAGPDACANSSNSNLFQEIGVAGSVAQRRWSAINFLPYPQAGSVAAGDFQLGALRISVARRHPISRRLLRPLRHRQLGPALRRVLVHERPQLGGDGAVRLVPRRWSRPRLQRRSVRQLRQPAAQRAGTGRAWLHERDDHRQSKPGG